MRCILLALSSLSADAATPPELLDAVAERNPTVQAAEARAEALRAATFGAGAWADPMVGLEVSNLPVSSFAFDHPMAGVQLRASQRLPLSGAPGAARDVAEARVAVGEAGSDEALLSVRRQIEVAWAGLAEAVWLEAVTAEHQQRTDELLDAVMARYEVGEAGQGAVLRLQVLRDGLDDDLDTLRARQASLRAALREATGVELPEVPSDGQPEGPPPDLEGWLERVGADEAATPALERLQAEEQVAEAEAAAARASGRPDPTVSAGFRVRPAGTADPNPEWVSVGVTVPIPAGSARRARGMVDAALTRGAEAEHRAAAERDRLEASLAAVHASWDRAHRQVERHRGQLLPVAEAARETTLSEYRVGRATVTDLYEAEVQLLRLERALMRAIAATWASAAESRALLATELPTTGASP